jgi:hypothetical protein
MEERNVTVQTPPADFVMLPSEAVVQVAQMCDGHSKGGSMKRLLAVMFGLILSLGIGGSSLVSGAGQENVPFPEVPRITKEELKDLLGKPDVVLLDCRPDEQWRTAEQKLPGAIHENPLEVASWAPKYSKDAKIIIY